MCPEMCMARIGRVVDTLSRSERVKCRISSSIVSSYPKPISQSSPGRSASTSFRASRASGIVLTVPIGGLFRSRCHGHEPCAREVAMGFDEPGQDRPPLEIELDVGIGQPALHVRVAADRDDSVVLDNESGVLSAVRIHREDVAIGPDLEPRRRRVQTPPRNAAAHDDQKNES